MENDYRIQSCDSNDVLSFGDNTYKVAKFRKAVEKLFESQLGYTLSRELSSYGVNIGTVLEHSRWTNEGIDCEILNLGSEGWKKGRIRLQFDVEFYIEEAVETHSDTNLDVSQLGSPLDDIRRMITEDN